MNKVLKWILGILVVLLVLAVIAGVAFLVMGRLGGARWVVSARSFPFIDGDRDGRRFIMPMHPGWIMPMGRGWFGGFFPLGMILGGLFWAAVIFLCVVGVISLFRGRKNTQQPAVSTVSATLAAQPAPEAPATVEASNQTAVHTCPNCARIVQEDWSHCAYCGTKLT